MAPSAGVARPSSSLGDGSLEKGGQHKSISFAAVVSKPQLTPRFPEVPLSNRQYGCADGKPVIHFTVAEFEAGAALFKHSLIAKFTAGRPSILEIQKALQETWRIKGRVTLSEIWDGRHIMVILDSDEDATTALSCPIRKIGHAMFRLFRYTTEYDPRRESTITTKWVRLPALHPAFFTKNFIGAIVNSFGTFLDTDDSTKACAGLRFARACVEVDVSQAIPDVVTLSLSDGRTFTQKIEVEGNLFYCSHCKLHGHKLADCRKKKSSQIHEVNETLQVVTIEKKQNRSQSLSVAIDGDRSGVSNTNKSQEWMLVKKKNRARSGKSKGVPVQSEEVPIRQDIINHQKSQHDQEEQVEGEKVNEQVKEKIAAPVSAVAWFNNILEEESLGNEGMLTTKLDSEVMKERKCKRSKKKERLETVEGLKVINSDTAVLETVEGLKGRAERMVSKEDNSCARSSLIGPGKEQSQRGSSDSDEWSVSDESQEEERSSIHFGKTLKASQMIKRREYLTGSIRKTFSS